MLALVTRLLFSRQLSITSPRRANKKECRKSAVVLLTHNLFDGPRSLSDIANASLNFPISPMVTNWVLSDLNKSLDKIEIKRSERNRELDMF